MNMINAVVADRKIEIEAPSELPDGSQVTVLLVATPTISSDPMTRNPDYLLDADSLLVA